MIGVKFFLLLCVVSFMYKPLKQYFKESRDERNRRKIS